MPRRVWAIAFVVAADGVRVCHGDDGGTSGPDLRLKSFDSVPLEVYVILPPAPSGRPDGDYPLVVQSHGWGGTATGLADSTAYLGPGAGQWATKGYAVLQLTARGFGDSCGRTARTAETPAHFAATCAKGYVHLDDERYEAHDVQYASGLLADAGIVNPAAIGVTGPSYGGGVSLELATLKDRVMNANGTLSPWRSPAGSSRAASSAPYARARIRSSCSREALGAGSCAAAWTSPPAISRSSSTRSTLFTSTTTVSRHAVVAATR